MVREREGGRRDPVGNGTIPQMEIEKQSSAEYIMYIFVIFLYTHTPYTCLCLPVSFLVGE